MNKKQLINKLQEQLSEKGTIYPLWELNEIAELFLDIISDSLKQGNDVSLHNFGRFSVRTHKGRNLLNIHTKRMEFAPDRKVIIFSIKKERKKPL